VIPLLSRDQIRAFDRCAIEECAVPSLVLMENAGRGAAEIIERRAQDRAGPIRIVCGPGNNGGDGFVVARRLLSRGKRVTVLLAASHDRLAGDARANYNAWIGLGGPTVAISDANAGRLADELGAAGIVVDALLGTGLDREVTGFFASVIDGINRAPGLRIALDIPSGLDANTGQPLGIAVRADETVTFAEHKLGLWTSTGAEYAGRITRVDIGVPSELVGRVGSSARLLERADVASWLSPRAVSTHKGSAGRVAIVAGSPGKTGAALLSARGALRAGAGLVTICTFPDAADALDARVLEEMTRRIDPANVETSLDEALEAADVMVVGPGLGLGADARRVVDHVVFHGSLVKIVDADALTLLAGRLGELRSAVGRIVLTPHPGEMARLLGSTTAEVESDRFAAVARAVSLSGAVVLLKGARTLVGAPGVQTAANPSGTPALATAGSGDVLAGILAALAVELEPFHAACAAAHVHGAAGERWASARGQDRGLLAHEIADGVPAVLAELAAERNPLPV